MKDDDLIHAALSQDELVDSVRDHLAATAAADDLPDPEGCVPLVTFLQRDRLCPAQAAHIRSCNRCGSLLESSPSLPPDGAERYWQATVQRLRDLRAAIASGPGGREFAYGVLVVAGSLVLFHEVIRLDALAPTLIGSFCLLCILSPRALATARALPRPRRREEDGNDDHTYEAAVEACLRERYELAREKLVLLVERGHVRATYLLACLYAFADSTDLHLEARRLFTRLNGRQLQGLEVRVGLARALLAYEEHMSPTILKNQLGYITKVAKLQGAELAAAIVAQEIGLCIQGDSAAATQKIRTCWSDVERAAGAENPRALDLALSRILALALPLDLVPGDRWLKLVPRDLAGTKRERFWARTALFVRSDVPVFNAESLPSDAEYSSGAVDRFARWIARRGIPANALGVVSLFFTVGAAVAIAAQMISAAAAILAVATVLDGFDGRSAQIRDGGARRSLFVDYLLDRVGDVALGLGFYVYFWNLQSMALSMLASGFIAVSLLVSWVRAEGLRLGLEASGGLFERPHRLLVLVAGLAAHAPGVALLTTTALTLVTVGQRILRGLWSARTSPAPVRDLELRLRPTRGGDGAAPDRVIRLNEDQA